MTTQIIQKSTPFLGRSNYDKTLDLMSVPKTLTIDTESGETRGLLGLSCCFSGLDEGFYLGWNHDEHNLDSAQKQRLSSILSDESKTLVFHNAPYDLKVLERNDLVPRYRRNFYDTMLLIHWINENLPNYSLDRQSTSFGGQPKNRSKAMQYIIDTYGWDGLAGFFDMTAKYSSNDAFITDELFGKVLPEFQAQGFDKLWHEWEEPFIWVIANMIERGIKIDVDFCLRELFKGEAIMTNLRAELHFNPSSPLGLERLLIDQLGLPVIERTPGGKPSFNKKAMEAYDLMLESMHDERARKVLRYRGWQKTTSSNYTPYLRLKDKDNVLHPGYKIHGTKTGRNSCEKPNLSQIPKSSEKEWNGGLKKAFIPRPSFKLWEFDYSQLQFRLTCAYAEQDDLIEIFNDPDRDIFQEMATEMRWTRDNVKTLVYLILFGGGGGKAAQSFGVSVEEGHQIIQNFHRLYPKIQRISKKAQSLATKRGYVQYFTGRRRHFPKGSKYYRAFNSIIQGGEAEIIKHAMVRLESNVCNEEECRMVLTIYDSIVFEIAVGQEHRYLSRIKECMESVDFDFGVRFPVQVKQWAA